MLCRGSPHRNRVLNEKYNKECLFHHGKAIIYYTWISSVFDLFYFLTCENFHILNRRSKGFYESAG